jgi:hypothetical protein
MMIVKVVKMGSYSSNIENPAQPKENKFKINCIKQQLEAKRDVNMEDKRK